MDSWHSFNAMLIKCYVSNVLGGGMNLTALISSLQYHCEAGIPCSGCVRSVVPIFRKLLPFAPAPSINYE